MICHHYKCIFVHIPKNAGQSIEHVFLKLLNLTWETRAPLLLRTNNSPTLGPPRLAHLKADEYVKYKYLTEEMFNSYFKFAFVRNPWSRMVSIYKYLGFNYKCNFNTFLTGKFQQSIFTEMNWFVGPQFKYMYSCEGELLVDFVGKFEDFQDGFDRVCKEIGLPKTTVPHINGASERETSPVKKIKQINLIRNTIRNIKRIPKYSRYQEYYDQESIDLIAELYKDDIKLFKYDF